MPYTAQSSTMYNSGGDPVNLKADYAGDLMVSIDGSNADAFNRLRVSQPQGLFDAKFTYDLQPLLYQQISTAGTATVTHDATNRCALMTHTASAANDSIYMQSYEWIRYQPGKSQLVFITLNFGGASTDIRKYAGIGTASNGIEFALSDTTGLPEFKINSDTTNGDQTVTQASWNIDHLDGNGPSGYTLNTSKTQIMFIQYQALFVGQVTVGFDIDGKLVPCHQFNHANSAATPYIQQADLPVRVGMDVSGTAITASGTMRFICCSVISEGGQEDERGYPFTCEGTASAADGVRTHILSLRPKTTFNSIANRTSITLDIIDMLVTGNFPIKWELCVGQAISGTTTYTDVNSTYSAFAYNTAGTISGSPTIVIASGYIASSAQNKGSLSHKASQRIPITLDMAGAVRALGTLSLIVTGIGGASNCRASFNWHEHR